jgi:hypothetical protein
MTVEEASERYRAMKTMRRQVERLRRRLPAPPKDKEKSFLPAEAPKKSDKPKGNKGNSKGKKKK